MSCPKGERCFPFKACLIWTISSDNQETWAHWFKMGSTPLLPLWYRQMMFNKQWCSASGFLCRLLLAHPQNTRTERSVRGEGRALHAERSGTNVHRGMCGVHTSCWIHPPPPPWNVFSNLSVMCCLKGAAVTQVQLLLSEAGFSLYTPGPVSLNPGLRGVGPEQKER